MMMNKKIAFIFPGQGAQYVAMGKDFYDQFPIARRTFEEADAILGRPFSRLIFEGPSDELTLTKNSQVAIYIVSVAIWRTLQEQYPDLQPCVCAGLSLGEYTALAASSKISFSDGLKLVQARAQYMNDACDAKAGTMSVVLGLEPEVVESVAKGLKEVWVANLNCPGQVVISGTKEGIEAANVALKEKGAKRTLPLEVSGAFHSGLMMQAQERLMFPIMAASFSESPIELVMNVPGDYVFSLDEIRKHLIHQVTSPVRWEKGVRAMMDKGIDFFIEIGCGKTLSGMNKKIGAASTFSIEKVSDLEELSKFLDVHYATIEK
jgi:[acyl-carrier-protein] S-malonyltransferase